MSIRTVGVLGLGTMGAGIAEVVARHGYSVVAIERGLDDLSGAAARIQSSIERAVAGGKMRVDDQAAVWQCISLSSDLNDLADVDLVIEAVTESLELKKELLSAVDAIVPPRAILVSNTSSLSVTDLAVATRRPDKVVGIHFFNPAPVQSLVEVVRTVVTAQGVVDEAVEFARSLGKEPVVMGDRAGFIANALLFGYLNHATSMFESRYASREDIDDAMRLGCGYPMGPLMLLDLIGLDKNGTMAVTLGWHLIVGFLAEDIRRFNLKMRGFVLADVVAGEVPSPIAPPPGCHFHPRCPFATERCRTEKPELRATAATRFVACHHPV